MIGKYLGFPLLNGRARKQDFHFIIEKLSSQLASWMDCFLNKPRIVALAASVLSLVQNVWLLCSICDTINSKVRNFV